MSTKSSSTFPRKSAPRPRSALLFPAAIFVITALTACGSDTVTAPPTAASIVLSAPSGEVAAGGTLQYTAVVKDANGKTIDLTPTWTVVNGGGTINSSGLFTAGTNAGAYDNTVVATSGSATASSSVTVLAGSLSSIVVSPAPVTLQPGATQQFTVVGKDANDNVVAVVPAPVWSTAAGGGTIDANGLFTAGTVSGQFTNTIHVVSGTLSASTTVNIGAGALASIVVTPATVSLAIGGGQLYTAVGKDAHDNVVAITPTWSVAANGGTIDAGTGQFTAGTTAGAFTNTVVATSGSVSGTASVTVVAGPLSTLTISPASATIGRGTTQQFTVVGKDAHNNPVSISPTWLVAAGGGTIDTNGLFTAGLVAGTYTNTVLVTSGTVAAVATVTVTGP